MRILDDKEALRWLRSLRRITDNPELWPSALHALAVKKIQRVRQIVGEVPSSV